MNYKELKLGRHGIPTWDAMIPLILEYLSDGRPVHSKKIAKDVSDSLELPDELRQATYINNPDSIMIEDRVKWGISELFTSGCIERPSRAIYEITTLGKELLKLDKSELTEKKIHSLPDYVSHKKELLERNKRKNIENESVDDESDDNVVEELVTKTELYNNEIATNLLRSIQEAEPTFFEKLVVKLLTKMGYKGNNGTAKVTQPTNDFGIDGIINQDPLGTNTVYLQAKRYKESNVVQRPEIDRFFGALSRIHADRGVFITTSHFSESAIETAKSFSIVLIDGIQLTNLMLQYQVGVQVKQSLELFEIDDDFFDN
ncbi:restriction endonuclease [Companilactobacillus sp.]|uniref:restriction endonuclease n=1 Tax=Companilactobacillus sp. TaxID=2767905 RepID=UPI0025B7D365|nr:restriction endonuclease [Companilactobacillus sp.]MCH4010285.1 restriction endonuclease [Companilactobacillus sp.]MCH4052039.1 restriction endonuclease [Companilactobacillus sp.]MCH4078227.1 restriction endonuclease [Companilactobacillus sp.]MCH4126803.1 restriction endonuclease [Companilactobacillus sp.]MCH4132642.1 restriction endonuclease [Companilactobacillus sp.]